MKSHDIVKKHFTEIFRKIQQGASLATKDELDRTPAECIPFYAQSDEERRKASKLAELLKSDRDVFKISVGLRRKTDDEYTNIQSGRNRIQRRHSGKEWYFRMFFVRGADNAATRGRITLGPIAYRLGHDHDLLII